MAACMTALLSLDNVAKHFSGINILKDISLAFAAGTVTAIVGDNGAGKSTLLKIMSGALLPSSGMVTLNGANIIALNVDARRMAGIEMVYQDLALAPQQNVMANMYAGRELLGDLGRLNRRAMRDGAVKHLQELGIDIPNLDLPVGMLSGGQRQALAIARAAMFSPKVLLLDEPTAALAVREVERVLDLIRRQKAAGRAVVVVSHRLNDVFAVADRIVVLKQGRVISDDVTCAVTLVQTVERIVS